MPKGKTPKVDYTPGPLGHASIRNKRRDDSEGLHPNVYHCEKCYIFIQKLPAFEAKIAFENHKCTK